MDVRQGESMNTFSGPVDPFEKQRRSREHAALRREADLALARAREMAQITQQHLDGAKSVHDAEGLREYHARGGSIGAHGSGLAAVGADYDAGNHYAYRPALNNPAKVFTRETILAVFRIERTRPQTEASLETLNRLQSIFENLE